MPLLLLSLLSLKLTVTGASIGDALALCGLAALFGYRQYTESKKPIPINEEVIKKLNNLESAIVSVKMAQGLRSVNEQPKRF